MEGLDEKTTFKEEGEGFVEEATATTQHGQTRNGAKDKEEEMILFEERHWAATETFYAQLATATDRLEGEARQEKG